MLKKTQNSRRRYSTISVLGIVGILIFISIIAPLSWGEFQKSRNDPEYDENTSSTSGPPARATILNWPMFGKDAGHSNAANPVMKGIYQPALKWDHWNDYITGNGIDSWGTTIGNFTPNIKGNYDRNVEHVVYAENGFINIVDGESGEMVWRLDVDLIDSLTDSDMVFTTPTLGFIDNNQYLDIVFGTNDGKLYMYEPESNYDNITGYSWSTNNVILDKVWEFATTENFTQSSPVLGKIDTDTSPDIIVGAGDRIFAVSGATGKGVWNKTLLGNVISSPIIYKDGIKNRVMVTSFRQSSLNFSASFFDAETGNTLDVKFFNLGLTPNTLNLLPSPATAELDGNTNNDKELIVVTPFQGITGNGIVNVYHTNRNPIWTSGNTISGQIDASPAVGDLDGDTIPEIVILSWTLGTLGPVSHLYAFHGNNGSLMWHIVRDTISVPPYTFERTVSSPILADLEGDKKLDVLFATSPILFAIDGLNGTNLWEYSFTQTGRQLWSSPAAADIDKDNFLDVILEGAAISHVVIDLTLSNSDFYLSHENITENQQVTIYAIVHNQGTAPAENVKASFFDNNELIGNGTQNYIPPEDSREISISWSPAEEGQRTLKVLLDPENTIEEIIETNNELSKQISVLPSYPDLVIDKVEYYRGDGKKVDNVDYHLIEGEGSIVKVYAKNIGDDEAENLIISAKDAGTPIGNNKELSILDISEIKNVTYNWQVPNEGEHKLNISIDFKNTGIEINPNNNFYEEIITVNSKTPTDYQFICKGVVNQPDGITPATGIDVRFTNNRTGMQQTTTTNETGHYSTDLSKLPGRYLEGDEFIIYASDGENATSKTFSIYSEDRSRFDNITLVKVPTYAISISVDDGSKEVLPNSKVEYKITISNRGNEENNVELTISEVLDVTSSQPAANWKASLNQYLLTNIPPKNNMPVILTLEAPTKRAEARAGDQVLVVVTAKSTLDPAQEDLVGMTTTVGRIYELSIEFASTELELDPVENRSIDVDVKIKNNGNDDDSLKIALNTPDEWQAIFNDTMDLLIEEEKDIIITLTCNEKITAGIHSFALNITPIDGSGTTIRTFTVEILRPDIEFLGNITMLPTQPKLTEAINFEAVLYNSGTAMARMFLVELWVRGLYFYAEQIFNLSAGASLPVNFTWTPQNTGKYQIELKIDPQELLVEISTENNNSTLQLDFFADVYISELKFSNNNPMDGDKITIKVTIENNGNVDIRTSFSIEFYDGDPAGNGRLINEVTVFNELPIPVGEELDISTDWVANGPGTHTINVEANPDIDFKESDYENNFIQKSIEVFKQPEEERDYNLLIALVFIIGIVLIIFLVLTPSKQKGRKAKTEPKTKGKRTDTKGKMGKDEEEEKAKTKKKKKPVKKAEDETERVPTPKDEVKFKVVDEGSEPEGAEAEVTGIDEEEVEEALEPEAEEAEEELLEAEEGTLGSKVGKRFSNLISGRWLPTSKAGTEITTTDIEEEEIVEELEPELGAEELEELEVAEVEVVGEEEIPVDELEPEEVEGLEEEEYEVVSELEDEKEEEAEAKKKKGKRKKDSGLDYSHMIGIR